MKRQKKAPGGPGRGRDNKVWLTIVSPDSTTKPHPMQALIRQAAQRAQRARLAGDLTKYQLHLKIYKHLTGAQNG